MNGIPEVPTAADAVFMHVDTTVLPNEYAEFAEAFPIGSNTHVRDISQRKIIGAVLDKGDHWGAIVK